MNKTRLYLYDKTNEGNGYRGTDLSAYVMQGDELAERLNNSENRRRQFVSDISLDGRRRPCRKADFVR